MSDLSDHFRARYALARNCTLACYSGLLALFLCLNILHGSLTTWLMQTVPLLIVLPGLLANKHRSYSWLCFVILIYFTAYVVEVMSPIGVWTDALALALSVVIFTGAMLASRWLQHWHYHESQAGAAPARPPERSTSDRVQYERPTQR